MNRKLLSDRVLFTAGVVLIAFFTMFFDAMLPDLEDRYEGIELFAFSIPVLIGIGLIAWSLSAIIAALASRLRSVP